MNEAPTVAAGTPKLLELDKKDVEAVRSFLPGKVLGRTAALLALVVLVLGFAGSLDVGLERFLGFPLEPPWLKYTVLIGLPVLIVGAQILAEWASRAEAQTGASAGGEDRRGSRGLFPHRALSRYSGGSRQVRSRRPHPREGPRLAQTGRRDAALSHRQFGLGQKLGPQRLRASRVARSGLDGRRGARLAGPGGGAWRSDQEAGRGEKMEAGRGEDPARPARSLGEARG